MTTVLTASTTMSVTFDSTDVTVPIRLVKFSEVVLATATNDGRLVRRRPDSTTICPRGAESNIVVDLPTGNSDKTVPRRSVFRQLCCSGCRTSAGNVHLVFTQVIHQCIKASGV